MPLTTVDVVLELPDTLHHQALRLSALLVERMWRAGHPSHFQLGLPGAADGAGAAGACAPHVSLFMLAVAAPEIDGVLAAVQSVAAASAPLLASGERYGHNPQGAPELYFELSAEWHALQRAVVAVVEPLRRRRLRDVDPAGERVAELVERLRGEGPRGDESRDGKTRDGEGRGGGTRDEESRGERLRQLLAYGYDEVGERFHPHVTLAWPVDAAPVDLAGLPAPARLTGVLTHLAVFGMGRNGTCITRYGTFPLTGRTDGAGRAASAGCADGAGASTVPTVPASPLRPGSSPVTAPGAGPDST